MSFFGKSGNDSKDRDKDEAIMKLGEKLSGIENVLKRYIKDSNERMSTVEKRVDEALTRASTPPPVRPVTPPSISTSSAAGGLLPTGPKPPIPMAPIQSDPSLTKAIEEIRETMLNINRTVNEQTSRIEALEEAKKKTEVAVPAPSSIQDVGDQAKRDLDRQMAKELWKAHKKTAMRVIKNYTKTLERSTGEEDTK